MMKLRDWPFIPIIRFDSDECNDVLGTFARIGCNAVPYRGLGDRTTDPNRTGPTELSFLEGYRFDTTA